MNQGEQLPLVVRRVVERRNPARIRMNVNHARTGLFRAQHDGIVLGHPVLSARHRIRRDGTQISSLHEVIDGLWRRLLVQRVIID